MDAVIQVQILQSSNDILEHALKITHPHAITLKLLTSLPFTQLFPTQSLKERLWITKSSLKLTLLKCFLIAIIFAMLGVSVFQQSA
jgi:hypothetical protein